MTESLLSRATISPRIVSGTDFVAAEKNSPHPKKRAEFVILPKSWATAIHDPKLSIMYSILDQHCRRQGRKAWREARGLERRESDPITLTDKAARGMAHHVG
jgi:hypothetical protein